MQDESSNLKSQKRIILPLLTRWKAVFAANPIVRFVLRIKEKIKVNVSLSMGRKNLVTRIIGRRCPYKGWDVDCKGPVNTISTGSAYHYTEADRKAGKRDPNIADCCEAHAELIHAHYKELWDMYWSDRL